MKRVLRTIGLLALCAILLPLFAAFLFAMPVEFAVATWHNLRVDSTVKGSVTKSEVTEGKSGNEGSLVTYSFKVDGVASDSSRWRAGLFSNSSHEIGGGEFARSHPRGTNVDVLYDSSEPGFSLLKRGWPKWSLGFSMGVWGMLTSSYFKRNDQRTLRLYLGYPASRALSIAGILTIMLFPPTLSLAALKVILIGVGVIALCALLWLVLGGVSEDAITQSST